VPRTQEDRKADTRARLLDAAAEQFGRDGFHATSIDAIADAADRTSGSVYARFGGKAGLLQALLDSWEGRTAREVGEALAQESTLEGRLAALWRAVGEPPAERADAWMLLEHELWLYAARTPDAAPALAARYRAARTGMAQGFRDWGAGDGALDADQLATVALALLFGLEMLHRADPTSVDESLATTALAALFAAP
jgi:AcrR family transcriptional regulator